MDPFFVLAQYPTYLRAACQPLGNHGGFSGALLWRITSERGDWCLRAWPERAMDRDRLGWIHQLLAQAQGAGLTFVPEIYPTLRGHSCAEYAGRMWEILSWMPGKADFWQVPSKAKIEAACTALAELHAVWKPVQTVTKPWPAAERRMKCLQAWKPERTSTWRRPSNSLDPVTPVVRRAWPMLRGWASEIQEIIDDYEEVLARVQVVVQPCLCDVWHDHVLFTGDRVTGLIDYGSVKEDHYTVDLARLLGSMAEDDESLWHHGLAAYAKIRVLSEEDIERIRWLDRTGVEVAIVNWLIWLYQEDRPFENRQAVAERLDRLVKRMEKWKM